MRARVRGNPSATETRRSVALQRLAVWSLREHDMLFEFSLRPRPPNKVLLSFVVASSAWNESFNQLHIQSAREMVD
jgi:hypothetical protein